MIYSGIDTGSVTDDNKTGNGTSIGASKFNEQSNDNAYVGYMYGTPGSDTYEETHANINDSTIKQILDEWYEANLIQYANYISVEAGFCGDRISTSNILGDPDNTGGYGDSVTYYGARQRIYVNKIPSLNCSQKNDLFTTQQSTSGNQKLIYPIGLLTADEVVFAGGVWNIENQQYYLYNNGVFWLISPDRHTNSSVTTGNYGASGFTVSFNGSIYTSWINNGYLVRPVINLKADVTISGGDGTSSNPYTIS